MLQEYRESDFNLQTRELQYTSGCYETPKEERSSCAFEHLIQNVMRAPNRKRFPTYLNT